MMMTMKISQFTSYWTPDQALDVLQFLEQLRDVIWNNYQDMIIEDLECDREKCTEEQLDLEFNDAPPF